LLKLIHFLFPTNTLPTTAAKLQKLIKTNINNNVEVQRFRNSEYYTQCRLAPQIANFIEQIHGVIGKENTHEYQDISSSEFYREKKALQRQPSLNLMISSDGISVCKSTINHTWPVIFSLIEVPNSLKTCIKNCFVPGIHRIIEI
jgi:hypothetical protein